LIDFLFWNCSVSLPAPAEKRKDLFPTLGDLFNLTRGNNACHGFPLYLQNIFTFFDVKLFEEFPYLRGSVIDGETLGHGFFSPATVFRY
jgi:hypothetical protein